MAYLKVIEENMIWTCPKTADYKVICVAGGCTGGFKTGDTTVLPCFGGDTSFGEYIIASGSINGSPSSDIEFADSIPYEPASSAGTSVDVALSKSVYHCGPMKGFLLHNSPYGHRRKTMPFDVDDTNVNSVLHMLPVPEGYGAGGNSICEMSVTSSGTTKTVYVVNSFRPDLSVTTPPMHGGSCGKLSMGIITIAKDVDVQCVIGKSKYSSASDVTEANRYKYGKYTFGNDGVIVIQEV